jgi:hypothetical protein
MTFHMRLTPIGSVGDNVMTDGSSHGSETCKALTLGSLALYLPISAVILSCDRHVQTGRLPLANVDLIEL